MARFKFPERRILITLLFIAGTIWAFVAIADQMADGGSGSFDQWMLRAFRRPENPAVPIGPVFLLAVVRDLSALGGGTVIALVTATVLGFLWLQRKGRLMVFLF